MKKPKPPAIRSNPLAFRGKHVVPVSDIEEGRRMRTLLLCRPEWEASAPDIEAQEPTRNKKKGKGPAQTLPGRMLTLPGAWEPEDWNSIFRNAPEYLELRWHKPPGESWIGDLRSLPQPESRFQEGLQMAFLHWILSGEEEDDPAGRVYAMDLLVHRMLEKTQRMVG